MKLLLAVLCCLAVSACTSVDPMSTGAIARPAPNSALVAPASRFASPGAAPNLIGIF